MTRETTCCFTGHRNIHPQLYGHVVAATENAIAEHYRLGYRYFICGGAYGFDMLAEEALVRAIKSGSDIHLILALPCRNQTERWDSLPNAQDLLRRYLTVKGFAESIYYVRNFYVDGLFSGRDD